MALACLLLVTYATAAYFLLIHLDAAEGIMTSFLAEHELVDEAYARVTHCPQNLKQRIEQLEIEHSERVA